MIFKILIYIILVYILASFLSTKEKFVNQNNRRIRFREISRYARKTFDDSFKYLINKVSPDTKGIDEMFNNSLNINKRLYSQYDPKNFCPYLGYFPDSVDPNDCSVDEEKRLACVNKKSKKCKKICHDDVEDLCKTKQLPKSWSIKLQHNDPYFYNQKKQKINKKKFKKLVSEYKSLFQCMKFLKKNDVGIHDTLIKKYVT